MPATAKTQTIGGQQVNTAEMTGLTFQQMFSADTEALRLKSLTPDARAVSLSDAITKAQSSMNIGDFIITTELEIGSGIGGNTYQLMDVGSSGARPAADGGSVIHIGSAGLYLRGCFPGGVFCEQFSTPQQALTYCATNGKTLRGDLIYELSDTVDVGSANIDMRGTFKAADSFPGSGDGVILRVGANKGGVAERRVLKFGVDGNRASQSNGVISVRLQNYNAPQSETLIHTTNSYTGVQAYGNTEKVTIHVGGYNCDLLAHELSDGSTTPDELNWTLSGNLCKQWFKSQDEVSSSVHFACENTVASALPCLELLGKKSNVLSGEIRGVNGEGILINDASSNLNVTFNELQLLNITGAGDVLNVTQAASVTGAFIVKNTASDRVAKLRAIDSFADLSIRADNVTLSDANNYCVELGEGSNICKRASLKLSLINVSIGKSVNHINTEQCTVKVNCATGEYNFEATALDDDVSLPANYIQDDIPVLSVASQSPSVNIRGNFSITELDAYSYGFEGMSVNTVRTWDSARGVFITNGFTPADRVEYATAANLQDISHRVNTKGKHTGKLVRVTDTRELLHADNQNANGTWRTVAGVTAYTPS